MICVDNFYSKFMLTNIEYMYKTCWENHAMNTEINENEENKEDKI